MKAILRRISLSVSRGHGSWLTLLLLLVVIVPSASLLWFVNRAAQNERLAARQKLSEAYRGQLALARERLDAYWKQTAIELDAAADKLPAPALFAKWVQNKVADSVICFDSTGGLAYPRPIRAAKSESPISGWAEAHHLEWTDLSAAANAYAALAEQTTNINIAAAALQAQARCLVQAGRKNEASTALSGWLADKRYEQAIDSQGRFIVPNASLMEVELLKDSDSGKAQAWRDHLHAQLLDYNSPMPSAQRLFLMRELLKLFPSDGPFPTLAAEELATRYAETSLTNIHEPILSASSLPGVWQFASASGRVITLHQTENLPARLRAAVFSQELPAGVNLDFIAPDQESDGALLSLPAGPQLPGWRLTLALQDQHLFDAAASEQVTSYIWIGVLVVATVMVLAVLVLGLARRQTTLTQLRNDLVANVTHELKTPLSSMRLLVETLLNSPQIHEQTAREYLDLIAKENVRLSRLIDNFLTFSRIERNKYTFDFKEVPAAAIAESAAAVVRDRFNTPGCRFEVRIAPNLPSVQADSDALTTGLVNLLDNAYKYSGEAKQITLTAAAENGNVRFAVEDNGIGLSPRDRKRIFKRFYQVNQHLSSSGGCGLGLSILQFVVTGHRGTIRVESQPGRGSTFSVLLPIFKPSIENQATR